MYQRLLSTLAVGLLVLGAAACGRDAGAEDPAPLDPASGACLVGDEDCYETGAEGTDAPGDGSGAAGGACLVGDEDCYETGAEGTDAAGEPSMGMCAPGVTDCVDVVVVDEAEDCAVAGCDDTSDLGDGVDATLDRARELLGVPEAALPADIRVGRRGAESYALTMDHVPGRSTVELDEVDGVFVVSSVTVEVADGTVVYTAEES